MVRQNALLLTRMGLSPSMALSMRMRAMCAEWYCRLGLPTLLSGDDLTKRVRLVLDHSGEEGMDIANCVGDSSANLRLFTALQGVAGMKFCDKGKWKLLASLVTRRAPPSSSQDVSLISLLSKCSILTAMSPAILLASNSGEDTSSDDDEEQAPIVPPKGKHLWCQEDSYGYTKGDCFRCFIVLHSTYVSGRTLREMKENYEKASNFRLYPVAFVSGGKVNSIQFQVHFHLTKK